jgi:flavin reductase (DIM6/NTAB) family NADH-FMN oxidoreductase RutF
MEHRELRDLFGHFPTGVAIVTTTGVVSEKVGVTISSFNSVSLDPGLVMFSLTNELRSLPVYLAAETFGINFLSADQTELSNRFASKGADKWLGTRHRMGTTGVPLLEDALAHIECEKFQVVEGGDHMIFICRVVAYETFEKSSPLIFFKGRYRTVEAA